VAKYGSPQAAPFLIGGYSLVGYLTNFTHKHEALTEESHTLGSSWVENAHTGVKRWELSQEGFYDDASGGVHQALEAGLGASARILCWGVEGNTAGAEFVGASALEIDYERIIGRNELHKIRASFRGSSAQRDGLILRAYGGATASGNSTAAAVDFGASATNGGVAFLQIGSLHLDGGSATGFDVDVLHSADNLTFTSWAGFARVTATGTPAAAAQRISSTATLQRYAAVRWAPNASALTSAQFFVGLARTT